LIRIFVLGADKYEHTRQSDSTDKDMSVAGNAKLPVLVYNSIPSIPEATFSQLIAEPRWKDGEAGEQPARADDQECLCE
jgi:hypothetical protein